jgi:hypothetical protein
MELVSWLAALGISALLLIAMGLYLVRKLVGLYRALKPLEALMGQVTAAAESNPEVVAVLSALNDDPLVHQQARNRLQAKARALKARESRRLASRLFSR